MFADSGQQPAADFQGTLLKLVTPGRRFRDVGRCRFGSEPWHRNFPPGGSDGCLYFPELYPARGRDWHEPFSPGSVGCVERAAAGRWCVAHGVNTSATSLRGKTGSRNAPFRGVPCPTHPTAIDPRWSALRGSLPGVVIPARLLPAVTACVFRWLIQGGLGMKVLPLVLVSGLGLAWLAASSGNADVVVVGVAAGRRPYSYPNSRRSSSDRPWWWPISCKMVMRICSRRRLWRMWPSRSAAAVRMPSR